MNDTATKNTRMAHVTMRVPQEILDYFKQYPNPRAEMRQVLVAYVKEKHGWG